MTLETWLAFVAASTVLLVIPGPTILLVISYAIGQGRRVALPVAAGVALGDFTAMTLSLLGVGALLATSASLFVVLKWIGAIYLIWLGVSLWRAGGKPTSVEAANHGTPSKMLLHAWTVTALNPKGITFFVAFLPQFFDPQASFLAQVLVFESTFLALAAANAFGCALIADRARNAVQSPAVVAGFNRVGGTLLIGAGVATLSWRQSH